MANQLLIYQRAVPVSPQRHGDLYVKTGESFAFAAGVNAVPLLAAEIPHAAAEYPVVFTESNGVVMPALILGVRNNQNLFLTEAGKWDARYVPAFIRQYPFVVAAQENSDAMTLCIDEEFGGCNREGRGERLFDADGERTQYLENVVNFVRDYQVQFQRTKQFCEQLNSNELLEPMRAQFKSPDGQELNLTGFLSINRQKLRALRGNTLEAMAKTDALELAYVQLQTMRNFTAMVQRAGAGLIEEANPGPAAGANGTSSAN